MPDFSIDDLELSVDDFLSECSSSEIKEVRQWLKENDSEITVNSGLIPDGLINLDFRNSLEYLNHNYYRLSKDDELKIIEIRNKY